MARELLLTDLDNTLYDWNSFFASAFRGMVHAVARELPIDENTLIESFREVYQTHGNVEYAFAIQELSAVRDLSDERVRELIRVGRGAFQRVRSSRLRPYDGTVETLRWVAEQGIKVIAVSNAPLYSAQHRLNELRVDRLFDGIVAWEGSAVPEKEQAERFIEGFLPRNGPRRRSAIAWTATVDTQSRKPSTLPYKIAMEKFGAEPATTWVLGDSIDKDLRPAHELGATTLHAAYGTAVTQKNLETLLRITHWTAQEVESQYRAAPVVPDVTLSSIAQLRDVLPLNNPPLF